MRPTRSIDFEDLNFNRIIKPLGLFVLCLAAALLVYAYSSGKLPSTEEADDAYGTVYAYGESEAEQ